MGSPTRDMPDVRYDVPDPGTSKWLRARIIAKLALDHEFCWTQPDGRLQFCDIDHAGARPLYHYNVAEIINRRSIDDAEIFELARWIMTNHVPTKAKLEEYFRDPEELHQRFRVVMMQRIAELRDEPLYSEAPMIAGDTLLDLCNWILYAVLTPAVTGDEVASWMNYQLTMQGKTLRYYGVIASRSTKLEQCLVATALDA